MLHLPGHENENLDNRRTKNRKSKKKKIEKKKKTKHIKQKNGLMLDTTGYASEVYWTSSDTNDWGLETLENGNFFSNTSGSREAQ